MTDTQSDQGRTASSGALIGAVIVTFGLGMADLHMPAWCGFALNWSVILGACYVTTVYKRRWYGWLVFWGLAVTCLIAAILGLMGVVSGNRPNGAGLVIGAAIVGAYYWLLCIPRRQAGAPAPRSEVHVFHHVVHHGQSSGPAVVTAAAARAQFPGPVQKVIGGRVAQVITAPHRKISALTTGREEASVVARRQSGEGR